MEGTKALRTVEDAVDDHWEALGDSCCMIYDASEDDVEVACKRYHSAAGLDNVEWQVSHVVPPVGECSSWRLMLGLPSQLGVRWTHATEL